MNTREILFTLLFGVPLMAMVVSWIWRAGKNEHELRVARLQTLQEALKHPALDEQIRMDLTRLLADDYRRQHGPLGERFRRWLRGGHVLLLAVGWLLLIGGVGFWIAGEAFGMGRYTIQPAIAATIAGIALVTLPLALRELLGRRDRNAAPSRP